MVGHNFGGGLAKTKVAVNGSGVVNRKKLLVRYVACFSFTFLFFVENLTAVTASMLSSLAAVVYFCGVSVQVGLLVLECTEI